MYSVIKHIHLLSVAISVSLFVLRGGWMLLDSHWLKKQWIHRITYLVDTCLLASAVTLCVLIQQYPGIHHWLSAKVLALLLYIMLGSVALKRGQTKRQRALALLAALLCVAYIIGTALAHNPLSWFS